MVKTVLVTGASGFVAGHVIKTLMNRGGYHVRGTVRNVDDPKYSFLRELFPTLELFRADLLEEGSFDEAVTGCEVVFHTASPFFHNVQDPQKDLVDPALKGTLNVLNSVEKSGSVKRVIVTSSFAAIFTRDKPDDYVFSESDWNTDSSLTNDPYRLSKVLAEKAAHDFAQGKNFRVIAVNPSFVVGPVLSSRADATSIKVVSSLLDGSLYETGTKPVAIPVIDVRDVAEAHVRAAEKEDASGRYLTSSDTSVPQLRYAEVLRNSGKFQGYLIPQKEEAPPKKLLRLNNNRVQQELGLVITPFEKSLIDMAESLIQFGIVKPPPQ